MSVRVYSYAAKLLVGGSEVVEDQVRLAHRYRNQLVEAELRREDLTTMVLDELSPALAAVNARVKALDAAIDGAFDSMRRSNQKARKRLEHDAGAVTALKAERSELYAQAKELRREVFASEAWKVRGAEIAAAAVAARKELRAESGLYWGTYLHVEMSIDDATQRLKKQGLRVRFQPWTGEGHLAVQIQQGISPAEAMAGTDQRVQIAPPEAGADPKRKRRALVRMRVGSDGRAPVWADFVVVLHRPLPPDASIKWVHAVRKRVGTHFDWFVQFVLGREEWENDTLEARGAVGIDLGWRVRPGGSLRVAAWRDDEGARGEVLLPASWLQPLQKARDIASIRSDKFDAALGGLGAAIEEGLPLPEWWGKVAGGLASWKSPARLAALAIHWRSARFAGDAKAFDALEAWRKNDRHLLEYEANLLDTFQARRRDLYRNVAAQMRRRYARIFVEDMSLSDLQRSPLPTEKEDGAVREHARDAGVSYLREAIAGPWLTKVATRDTTRECGSCGHVEQRDGAMLTHSCSKCGHVFDQDYNAAEIILRRGLAKVGGGAEEAAEAPTKPTAKRRRRAVAK